jgi:tetratricopeptide (TPR) repeat protein
MIVVSLAIILITPPVNLGGVEPQVAKKIQALEKEVINNPDSAEAWGKLAMNLHAHDFQKESIECYTKAASLNKRDFRWTYYAAIAQQEIGSSDAIGLFEESLKRKSNYAPLHLRYAQVLFGAERHDQASSEFQRVLKLDPKSADAYLGLARIALSERKLDECRSNLLKAIELNPNLGEAHALLSEVYRSMNDQEQADKELLISLQLPKKVPPPDPELNDFLMEGVSSYWYELRGRALLQKGDYEDAIHELQLAAKALPDPRFYDTIGIAYQHQKKYREAIEQHQAALALDPTSAGTMNNLAAALGESGKVPEAIEYLRKSIAAQPDFAYSYVHLARLFKKNSGAEAIDILRKGNQQLPDNSELALQLAWLLSTTKEKNLQDCAEAMRLANEVSAKKRHQDPEIMDVMAAAYACSGDFDRAVETAQKAEQIATTDELKKRIRLHLKSYSKKQIYDE